MALRWAIVGCGGIANKRVAPAMVEDTNSDLMAFYSHSQDRAEEMKERFGAVRAYTDLEALSADDETDAVYVASPQDRHCAETLAARECNGVFPLFAGTHSLATGTHFPQ